jgi:beta-lactam-binding protein with PASTA domain
MGGGAVVVVAIVVIALGWFFWPGKEAPRATRRDRPDVDEAELAAAEREVQEAPDEESIRDWGPGTGQKPLP